MIEKITTHEADAIDRLIEQYRGKVRFEGLVNSFVEQIQDIEDAAFAIPEETTIETASGEQLDLIGTIVVQPRLGFSDEVYRRLLRAKIGENTSKATPEDVITVTRLLTGATQAYYQELYPAGFSIAVNTEIASDLVNFFYSRIDRVDPAAVRFEALIEYDADAPFAFEGVPGPSLGFSSTASPGDGGLFAGQKVRSLPAFSFEQRPGFPAGDDEGFGTLEDVLAGGHLQTL